MTLNGVPPSILRDAWWLDAAPPPASGSPDPAPVHAALAGPPGRALGLALLVALADLLFWDHAKGLSLALFAGAVFAAATVDIRPRARLIRPALLLILAALPVVEYLQPLSVAFLAVGLAGALVWARAEGGVEPLAAAALRLARRVPFGGVAALARTRVSLPATPRGFLRAWGLPLGGTLVFAALLIDANPVLARLVRLDFDPFRLVERALFWAGLALMLWPLIDRTPPDTRALPLPKVALPGLNAASALRALVMFNLVIGVQTVLDLTILAGGASLPEGMSHAEYAHRGAYPLLATALLAGAFALAARPFLPEHRLLKPLMLVWIGQNVALCLSALLRLDLYVGVYGLTYLRVHALIWMALVAAGLALTGWQVARGLPNRWLMTRSAALGLGTLYLCAFVNFAGIIAAHNLAEIPRDPDYLCDLPRTAAAAIRRAEAEGGFQIGPPSYCTARRPPRIEGWRDWGFRNWRVARYVSGIAVVVPPHEDPDRR